MSTIKTQDLKIGMCQLFDDQAPLKVKSVEICYFSAWYIYIIVTYEEAVFPKCFNYDQEVSIAD